MMTQLEHLFTVDRTSLSLYVDGEIRIIGDGQVHVYSDKQQQQLILRFVDHFGQESESIILTPQANAWLQDNQILVLERLKGGQWRLDCSASDTEVFSALQDYLSYFIKYTNRHQLRNALAMMNPITCKVNEVIARNVFLECEKGDDPKQPVFMETADFRPGQRKVRILYDTGNALIAGSDWVAYTMIMAGRTLARHIQSQARNYSNTVEPAEKTLRLSQTDRSYIETFFNVNRSLIKGAGDLLGKATAAAASGIHTLCADTQLQDDNDPVQSAKRHLGVSVLHAAQNVLAGLTMATGSVLGSSRDSAIEIIYKKFGEDAGFLAEQAVGSRKSEVADILVYYDGNGVARQVFVGPNNPSVYAMRQQDLSSNPVTRDPSGAELHESEFFHYARKEEEGVDLRSMIFNYEEEGPDGTAASSLYPAEALAHTDGHSQSSNQSRSEQHIVV